MRRALPALVLLSAAGAALAPQALGAGGVTLAAPVRIQTPGSSLTSCPIEGEPAVAVTSAGTWVGYNDDDGCPLNPVARLHLTSVQLIPKGTTTPRYVTFPTPRPGEYLSGDPALAPDPQRRGNVLLATLYQRPGGLSLALFTISPKTLKATELPAPTINPKSASDDKEFLASDTSPTSRFRGRSYLVWDDFAADKLLTFRAFDGKKWLEPVRLDTPSGTPDVAVAPNGDVAAVWIGQTFIAADETAQAPITVRVSHDGGKTFGKPVVVMKGLYPGRTDPTCPLRAAVGTRQRVSPSPRVAYDASGALHVVAALGAVNAINQPTPGVVTGGSGTIQHVVSKDGVRFSAPRAVSPVQTGAVQFDPAIAPTPSGGVAVEWLQTDATTQSTYDSFVAVGSGTGFGAPTRLSEASGPFAPATEALGNSNCYGIGDYTGLAPTSTGVTAVWPSGDDVATPYFDTDVISRAVIIT